MSFYVKIKKLKGNKERLNLYTWLNRSDVSGVKYHSGGWMEQHTTLVEPHLKFKREEDALAYLLANGGEFSTRLPEYSFNGK